MSIADNYRPQFTYTDYCLWEGRWELIDGMPYAMSPSPVKGHQVIAGNLLFIFKKILDNFCKHCQVIMQLDWKINEKTVVQPDLMIICNDFTTAFLEFPPSIVIEILSPSTSYKERHEKFELYQEQQVKYYLIIDPDFNKIEIYELTENGYHPVAVSPGKFEFLLENKCPISVEFDGVFGK